MHAWTVHACVDFSTVCACMHGILRCVHACVDFSTVCACMHGRLKVRACIRGPFHGVCMHAWTFKGVCMHALTFQRCVRACMDVSRCMRACVDFSMVYACMRGLFHGVCMLQRNDGQHCIVIVFAVPACRHCRVIAIFQVKVLSLLHCPLWGFKIPFYKSLFVCVHAWTFPRCVRACMDD